MGWGGGQIKQRVFKPFEKLLDERVKINWGAANWKTCDGGGLGRIINYLFSKTKRRKQNNYKREATKEGLSLNTLSTSLMKFKNLINRGVKICYRGSAKITKNKYPPPHSIIQNLKVYTLSCMVICNFLYVNISFKYIGLKLVPTSLKAFHQLVFFKKWIFLYIYQTIKVHTCTCRQLHVRGDEWLILNLPFPKIFLSFYSLCIIYYNYLIILHVCCLIIVLRHVQTRGKCRCKHKDINTSDASDTGEDSFVLHLYFRHLIGSIHTWEFVKQTQEKENFPFSCVCIKLH